MYYYSHWGHLVSLCCLQTAQLFTKSPREAADYLTYLKFLAIKGTCFQTKAILAFDQDYRATKAWDNFGGGTN